MDKFFFLMIPIVFISACVFPVQNAQVSPPSTATISTGDLKIDAESVLSEVKAGRATDIYFTAENKQAFDINDISLNVYDKCIFSGEESKTISLQPNKTQTWKWRYVAGSTDEEKNCNIRFKTQYSSKVILIQTIAVLQENEYLEQKRTGDIGKIKISSSSTSNPLRVTLRLSEQQPIVEGTEFFLYLEYDYYSGEGTINKLEKGAVKIAFPSNIQVVSCDDYSTDGSLSSDLVFVKGKAEGSVCKLKAKPSSPQDIKTLTLTANYKYMLDNSIIVKVKP